MRKNIRTKIVSGMIMVTMVVTMLCGCGKENISGTYTVSGVSENTPSILPKAYTNAFLKSEECQIDLMSDGSIIITASEDGEEVFNGTLDKYAIVDGKMKIVAPLGTTTLLDYKLSGKTLTLTDKDGNYVILQKE